MAVTIYDVVRRWRRPSLKRGVFSTRDTDRALQSLADSLPVKLSYRTDYWVKVVPTH